MRRDVRIVLVGDGEYIYGALHLAHPSTRHPAETVGKSTIITSLIKESYVAHASVYVLACFQLSSSFY
jgi:hypothetical protein